VALRRDFVRNDKNKGPSMTPTALAGHAATSETKGVAIQTPPTSPAAARNDGIEDARAALVEALEASFPDAEMRVLQDVADALARRITGPELYLADLTDDEEDVVLPLLSPAAWDALQRIARAGGGVGITSVILSPELSSGGQALVDRLKQLQVEYLDVSVPTDGDTIDFRDRHGDGAQEGGFRPQILHIRPGEPGSTLKHIFVPDGTTVIGCWQGTMNALVHFTDAQGGVLRSTPLFQAREGEWLDLDCIEQSNDSRDAFIDAVRRAIPKAVDTVVSQLYGKWLERIKGPVLDLSDCVGEEAIAVRQVPPEAWTAFRTDPLAAGVTTVIVSHELALHGLLPTGLHQQRNPHDPRAAFIVAAQPVLPDVPLGELFDKLLRRTRDTVLDLSDFSGDMAEDVRCLPQSAWNEFRRHPQAADLASIVVDSELFAGGPLVHGLSLHQHSSDGRQSPDPRTAFIAHAQNVPLGYPHAKLFDGLIRRLRGKTLDLRGLVGQDVQALRQLPQEAWKALLRHRRAAALQSIKVSPELFIGGPLVVGLKLRLNLKDPRAAFVVAAEPALAGRPVHLLFDMLVSRIRGDKLDLSDVERAVSDLRSLPPSAWAAFLKHPEAANLRSIIASDALFVGGPLVDTLQMELAPKVESR
jgi:hypothetical protein